MPDLAGDGQIRSVLAKRAYGTKARTVNYEMLLHFDRKLMFSAGDGTSVMYLSSVVVPADEWSYVAINLDAAEGVARFYLNGTLADSLGGVAFGPAHAEPLYIGAAGPGSEPFMGLIDEVRISKRVLGTSEIRRNNQLVHGEYYWWVRVTDASGNSTTSEQRHFVVNIPNTEAPAISSPPVTADSILYDMVPTFSWTPWIIPVSYDTVYYRLRVALRSDFSQQTTVDSITGLSVTWFDSLDFNQQFWWKVEGWVNTDSGLYTMPSNVLSFYSWTLGDMDHSHGLDISDLIYMVEYMFGGGPAMSPMCLGDFDVSCTCDISDLIYLVDYMFGDGPDLNPGCE